MMGGRGDHTRDPPSNLSICLCFKENAPSALLSQEGKLQIRNSFLILVSSGTDQKNRLNPRPSFFNGSQCLGYHLEWYLQFLKKLKYMVDYIHVPVSLPFFLAAMGDSQALYQLSTNFYLKLRKHWSWLFCMVFLISGKDLSPLLKKR